MAWTSVAPVQDRNGSLTSPALTVPPGTTEVDARLDCTPFAGLAHPFNSMSLQVAYETELSYDGGATWRPGGGGTLTGKADGLWGVKPQVPYPYVKLFFQPDKVPTHVRGNLTVLTGPITFGVSIQTVP